MTGSSFFQGGNSKTVGEFYTIIGWGRYHTLLFIVCGLAWTADAIEIGLLSFLKQEVVKEWEVDPVLLSLLQNGVFIGKLLGCFILPPLADRFGRRPAFLLANLGLAGFGLASALSPSFEWLLCFRFFVGIFIAGVVIPFDTLLECSQASIMDQVTFGVQYFWTFGTVFVNLVAALVLPMDFGSIEPWRILTAACTVPIILCILGYFVIEESPLWLQEQGRDDDALEVLNRIARRSRVDISEFTLRPFSHEVTPALCDVVRTPYRRRTISLSIMFLFALMGYYGASLADPYIFDTSTGTNYGIILFTACGEIFGVLAFSLVSWKVSVLNGLTFFFVLAGLFLYTVLLKDYVPTELLGIIVFVVRAACMSCSCGYFLCAPKAYPTYIRCTAHSFVNFWGCIGGLLATLAGNLDFHVQMGMYGTAHIICAIVTFTSSKQLQAEEKAFEVVQENLSGTHSILSVRAVENLAPSRRRRRSTSLL